MPHLVLTHALDDAVAIARSLKALSQTAEHQGFTPASIKAYAIKADATNIGGKADAHFAHLAFRLLEKPDRTPAVITAWLDELIAALSVELPQHTTLTAEAVSLPAIYRSATA